MRKKGLAIALVLVTALSCLLVGYKLLTTWQLMSMRVIEWEGDRYLWTAGVGGVVRWDVKQQKVVNRNFRPDGIDRFLISSEGQVWACGGRLGSLWIALFESGKWIEMDETWGLPGKPFEIVQTDDGTIWAATPSGFSSWNQETRLWEPSPIEQPGHTLVQGPDDSLWFGLENGVVRLHSGVLTHWTIAEGLIDNRIESLLAASDGSIWVGTSRGVSRWDGNQWQGWQDLGYPDPDGLVVYKFYETRDGTIWAATSEGIARWNGKEWMTFARAPSCGTIFTLLETSDDSFWVGCVGGIFRWVGSGFREYGKSEGISDNSIGRLTQGTNDSLYAITKSGIYLYDFKQDHWQPFPSK